MGYHIRVKICGVTTPEAAADAVAAGADAVGLNFYPKSPRYIDEAMATIIRRALTPFITAVSVFASESPERMMRHMRRRGHLDPIQSHGTWIQPAEVDPFPLILAVQIGDASDLAKLTEYLSRCRSAGQRLAAVLVDARVPGQLGGTGQIAPWELLASFRPGVPLILAGGLTPDNVAEAIRVVRPYAVDVASGVESAPGRKDPRLVRRFIDNARSAAAGLPAEVASPLVETPLE
jgi:phosphoribosylanthranilate isomerase